MRIVNSFKVVVFVFDYEWDVTASTVCHHLHVCAQHKAIFIFYISVNV